MARLTDLPEWDQQRHRNRIRAHRGDGMKRLVGRPELESFTGLEVVSRANQAAPADSV